MNRNSKIIISAIITAIFFQYPSISYARTIALVYDDSGSMKGKNKWIYANYASQSLAALLRQNDDTLAAVLMSSPGRVNRMGTGQKILERIRNQWGAKGETPYKAVETAMDELLKSAVKQTGAFDRQKQDWLIVMTDGQFFKSMNEAEKNKLRDDIKNRYIDKSRGLIRIVFFLIGEDADRLVPHLWEEAAPEQVDIVTAANEQDIVRKMSEIAAMITGRDIKDTDVVRKEKSICLTSLFPVRRITLFEQGISGYPAAVDGIEFPGVSNAQDTVPESLDIKSPKGNMAGKVTHCRDKMIMPAGEYVIRFKENIEKKDIQVLLETAVDFRVILRDKKGEIKAPDKNGVFKLCQSQDIFADIQFFKAESNEPLFLDAVNTKDLNVTVSFDTAKKQLTFDKNTGKFFSMPFAVRPGMQTLSAETNSPGYFHLKSNILTIEGENCIVDKKMVLSNNEVEVPYIYSEEPVSVNQSIDLKVDETGGKTLKSRQDYNLSAEGIPPGIFIRIQGIP